jgi:hypothetical protein
MWLMVAVGVVGLRRDWRTREPARHFRVPSAWPYPSAWWVGIRAATPIIFAQWVCLTVAWTFTSVDTLFGAIFLGLVPVLAAAVIWGLPKRIRPPALRERPTVASTWRRRS